MVKLRFPIYVHRSFPKKKHTFVIIKYLQINKKNMIRKLLLLSTIILLNSCIKSEDYEDLSIDINTSLPLGDFTINEDKLFELASVGEGGFTYVNDVITFQGNSGNISFIDSNDLKNVLKIESNINFSKSTAITIPHVPALEVTTVTLDVAESNNELDLVLSNGVKIDEALLSNGVLTVFVQPVNGVDFSNLIFTIDNFSYDGVPLQTATNSGNKPTEISLRDYKLAPSNGGREVSIKYQGSITVDMTQVDPTITEIPLDISVKMVDLAVREAKGFFGRQEFAQISQNVDLGDNSSSDFFEYIDEFSIADPSISMDIKTNINIPILVRIDNIYAISKVDGIVSKKELLLKDEFNKNRFIIDAANDEILINNSIFDGNNLLSSVITKDLTGLEVNITPIVNPTVEQDGIPNQSDVVNEFNIEDNVSGDLVYSIPLSGYFKNINITDTLTMDISSSEYDINEVSFAILAENTFPLDISLSLYTLDKNGEAIALSDDEIMIPSVVKNVNPATETVMPGVVDQQNVKIITLDQKASNRFVEAEDILFKISASSMNPENLATMPTIKFYRNSFLKMKMVLGVKGEIELE